MPGLRAVFFDFHETLISADRWMVMETRGIALELLERVGVGRAGADGRREEVERVYADLRRISRETGLEYSAREILRVVLAALGLEGRVADSEIDQAVEELFRSYLPDVTVKAGVFRAVEGLVAGGYRLGLISNAAYGPFITWALAEAALLARFERVVVSADVGIRKPRPQIFHAALGPMGLVPAEAVYVGNDYIRDVMGAKLAGLRAIWNPTSGDRDYRAYTRVQPDAVSDRLEQLPDLVESLDRVGRAEGTSPADGGGR